MTYTEKYNTKAKRINCMPVSVEYQNPPGFSINQSYQTHHKLLTMHWSNIILLFAKPECKIPTSYADFKKWTDHLPPMKSLN